jgi:hypothetical protein
MTQVSEESKNLPARPDKTINWLMPLKREIRKWQEWVQIGQVTRNLIRRDGFYDGADEALMDKLIERNLTSEETEEFTTWLDRAFTKCDKTFWEHDQEQLPREIACNF